MDVLQRIADTNQKNDQRVRDADSKTMQLKQMQQAASLEQTIFNSFRALVSVLEGDKSQGQAVAMVIDSLNKLEGEDKDNKTQIALIKVGLKTLEKELKAVPTDSLKQLPKFLEQKETIKVTNLKELDTQFSKLETAIKSIKTTVEAPKVSVQAPEVNVPAPVVNVPEVDLQPLKDAMDLVLQAIKNASPELTDGAVNVHQVNQLITEKFDEWKVVEDTFDEEDEPVVKGIKYYLNRKKVAELKFTLRNGRVIGVKKAKV